MACSITPPVVNDLSSIYIGPGAEQGWDMPSHYRDVHPSMQRLMARYAQGRRGVNLFLMMDGTVTTTQPPNWDPSNPTGPIARGWNPFTHTDDTTTLPASQQVRKVFWGGCANPVTDDEQTLLEAAGYTVDCVEVGYGEGGYGEGDYGE